MELTDVENEVGLAIIDAAKEMRRTGQYKPDAMRALSSLVSALAKLRPEPKPENECTPERTIDDFFENGDPDYYERMAGVK